MKTSGSRSILIGPTESTLTKRGNRFPNIADYLVSEGDDVLYITSNFYHAEKKFFSKGEINQARTRVTYHLVVLKVLGYKNNISVRRVISNLFFSIAVFLYLLKHARKEDIILLPSRPVELIFIISLIRRFKKPRIVLDIQDIWPDMLNIENKFKNAIFTKYCNSFLYPSLKRFNQTIHTAPSFTKWLHRYAPKVSSEFIPLGWENERWKDSQISIRSLERKKLLQLVCVAKLQHQIDILPILELLVIKPELRFTLIGEDGTGKRYEEVSRYISVNKITNVDIIGITPRDKMQNLLRDKHIGILPMISPSIPNKIFDYMASNLPIIVLGENDSGEFVKQNNIGWACEYSRQGLEGVIESLSLSDLRAIRNNVISVKERYSRKVLHKKIYSILHTD